MYSRTARRAAFLFTAAVALGVAVQCGGEDGPGSVFSTACETVYKDQCGSPCANDDACKAGLFCGADGKCTAECAPTVACPDAVTCSPRGRCGPDGVDGGPILGGNDATLDGTGGDACADIDVNFTKQKPTVVLLVDQSSSMDTDFPPGSGTSRWNVLRDALVDPDGGIVKRLESDVSFGLTLYSYFVGDPTCPRTTNVSHTFGNYKAIFDTYADASPVDNTPTAESIMSVVGFDDAGVLNPNGLAAAVTGGPKIVVLATDGDPDTCACPTCNGDQPPRDFVVWAAQRAFDAGVRTYVISVGAEIDEAHQQQVANVGLGFAANAGDASPLFRTNNRQQLVDALNQIILGARSCKFQLNGVVQTGTESQGTVVLNGTTLTFGDPNGWKLNGSTELELVGAACTTVKTTTEAQLSVRFPCGTVLPK